MAKLVVCPGHYQEYKGVYKNGYYEYDIVQKIVELLVPKLTAKSHEVIVLQGKLIDKVNSINQISPDISIEVHLGNTNNAKIRGSRSFYSQNNVRSKVLADALLEECVRMLGTKNVGCWIGWYKKISPTLVKNGKAPADWKPKIDLFLSKVLCTSAIIEPFYLSSPYDVEKFVVKSKYDFVAESIASGIWRYFESISNEDCPDPGPNCYDKDSSAVGVEAADLSA